MSPIIRNVIAVFLGVIIGAIVNSSIVSLGAGWFDLPKGVDPNDVQSIKENIGSFEAKHFLNPFLAHSIGTLTGAIVATIIAASHKMKFALVIGAVFLVGGIMMVTMIGGPIWFILVDLLLAYLPFAYLGGKIGGAKKPY